MTPKSTEAASRVPPAFTASDQIALVLATWFGCGYFPFGPGTVGALGGLAVAWAAQQWLGVPTWSFAIWGFLLCLPGAWASTQAERIGGKQDPGFVVVDEVAGQWIALSVAPPTALGWLAAFALFRLFDIWKPYPVRKLESLHGGWGIMADDAAAGIYAAIVLYVGVLSLHM
jgi:phosphatidylglycerophosphatase A